MRTLILVATDEKDSVVMSVIEFAIKTTKMTRRRPRWPTNHPVRRYMITPRMVRMVGAKTPRNVPNFLEFSALMFVRISLRDFEAEKLYLIIQTQHNRIHSDMMFCPHYVLHPRSIFKLADKEQNDQP